MKILSFIIILLFSFSSSAQISKELPGEWTQIKGWPEGATIIVWSEDFDSVRNVTRRTCLIVQQVTDTNNLTIYTISQLRTIGPDFNEWHIPTVYRHPPAGYEGEADPRHYTIKRTEEYQRIPVLREIESVWSRGWHYFNTNKSFNQTVIGINWKLWMIYYNSYPTAEDYKVFR